MDDTYDELSDMASIAAGPYLSFSHLFKAQSHTRAGTQCWMRANLQPNNARLMPMAEPQPPGEALMVSLMALAFRSGVIALKGELHHMDSGEFIESMDIGLTVSFSAYKGQYFWPAMVQYIDDTEALVKERWQVTQMGEVLRQCMIMFERHLRKYADSPATEETEQATKFVNYILENRPQVHTQVPIIR